MLPFTFKTKKRMTLLNTSLFNYLRSRRQAGLPAFVSCLLVLLLASCASKDGEADKPIARVEDRTVSTSELKASTNLNIVSLGESAEDWINEAVLTHHAGESDYSLGEALEKRLQSYRQRLLASLYLDSLLAHRTVVHPETARVYYANNIDTFQFQADAAIVLLFGFRHLEAAESALSQLTSSRANIDSVMESYHYDQQLVQKGRLMPLLEEAVFSAALNDFTGPIKSEFGYHIFMVRRFFRQGDTIPYAFVRKNIYEKLLQRQLPLARLAVLDSLREVTNIDIQD